MSVPRIIPLVRASIRRRFASYRVEMTNNRGERTGSRGRACGPRSQADVIVAVDSQRHVVRSTAPVGCVNSSAVRKCPFAARSYLRTPHDHGAPLRPLLVAANRMVKPKT
jgi:hypothetical protein